MDDVALMKVDGRKHKAVYIRPRHRQLYVELQKPEHKGQITSAMSVVGYSLSMQDKPKAITSTQSWKALLDEHLPQDFLARRHKELLDKREGHHITYGRGKNRKTEFIDRGPDTTAVGRGLEMAYKLRGSFVSEPPVATNPTNIYNLFYKPEVRAQVSAFEDQLKHAIAHEVSANIQVIHDAPVERDEQSSHSGSPDASETA